MVNDTNNILDSDSDDIFYSYLVIKDKFKIFHLSFLFSIFCFIQKKQIYFFIIVYNM